MTWRASTTSCSPEVPAGIVFSEPQLDVHVYGRCPQGAEAVFAAEYLPGQYRPARGRACEECIQLVGQCDRPDGAQSARVYLLDGALTRG